MANDLQSLFDQKGQLIHQMDDVLKGLKDGETVRAMKPDELTKFKKMQSDLDGIQATIDANEYHRAALQKTIGKKGPDHRTDTGEKPLTYDEAFQVFARFGLKACNEEARAILKAHHKSGDSVNMRGTNTQITTTTTLGGYLVPEQFEREIEKYLLYSGPMLQVAKITNTQAGGNYDIPTINDTGNVGAIQGTEGGSIAVQDMAVGQKTMGAFTFHSGIVKMSYQLLEDDGTNLSDELPEMMVERIGRNSNLKFTVGSGSGEPEGVVTGTTTFITTASNSAIATSEILALKHSVDRKYRMRPNAGFMFNDATLLDLKQLTVGTGDARPLWQPGLAAGEPDRIDGSPYWINNDMADIAADAKPMLFGDMSKYRIRQVKQFRMLRSNDKYMDELAAGFLLWTRYDGKVVNTAAIKGLLNPS